MLWIWAIPGTILALGAFIYIAFPLVVWRMFKINANSTVNVIDPDQLSPDQTLFFDEAIVALESVGFVERAWLEMPDMPEGFTTLLVLFDHPPTRTLAMILRLDANNPEMESLSKQSVDFATEWTSGFEVDTGNSKSTAAVMPWRDKLIFMLPQARDVAELFEAHCYLTQKFGPTGEKRKPNIEPDPVAFIHQTMTEGFDRFLRHGVYRHDPTNDAYRLTLRGAYINTWRALWPISRIRHHLIRNRMAKLWNEFQRERQN